MGAYLSTPVCVKESEDGEKGNLRFGASSMQGWRISQEDAHCCLPDFDPETNTALFAVFDGHGGADVAQYTAEKLPDFVKSIEAYKAGKLETALEESFLGFDATLVEPDVVKILKKLATGGNDDDENEEDDGEAAMLCEEAEIPLESLLERYGGAVSVGGIPGSKALLALRNKSKEKFQSPALRSKAELKLLADAGSEEGGAADSTRIKLDEVLANGASEKDSHDIVSDDTKLSTDNADSSNIVTDSSADISNNSVDSGEKDSTKSDNIVSSSVNIKVANGKTSELKTVAESDKCDAAESSACTHVSDGGNDLDVSHISEASDDTTAALNHSVDSNSSSNNSSSEESANSKDSIKLALASIRLKKTEIEAQMEKMEEEVDKLEEQSEKLEKSVAEMMAKNSDGEKEALEAARKEHQELQKKIEEGNEKIAELENERVAMRVRISLLKRQRLQIISKERAAKRAAAGKTEDDDDDDDDDEDGEDMSDELDDDDDDDDDDDEEEEDDDDDDECTAMMGGGDEPGQDSGCTAVVALLHGKELHVANAGDSRCVLSRGGQALDMSVDHKPEDTVETERIHKAGGRVTCDGRVNGGLNLSRAIGDHCYKQNKTLSAREQMITSLPDVKSVTIGDEDEFMVIACDGIWNVMTSQEVVDFVRERLIADKNCKLSKISEEMFDLCIAPDTSGDGTGCDNMTCVIVTFGNLPSSESTSTETSSATTGVTTSGKRKAEEDDAAVAKRSKSEEEITSS